MHFACEDYTFFDPYDKICRCLSCKKCLAGAGSTRFAMFLAHPPRPGLAPKSSVYAIFLQIFQTLFEASAGKVVGSLPNSENQSGGLWPLSPYKGLLRAYLRLMLEYFSGFCIHGRVFWNFGGALGAHYEKIYSYDFGYSTNLVMKRLAALLNAAPAEATIFGLVASTHVTHAGTTNLAKR